MCYLVIFLSSSLSFSPNKCQVSILNIREAWLFQCSLKGILSKNYTRDLIRSWNSVSTWYILHYRHEHPQRMFHHKTGTRGLQWRFGENEKTFARWSADADRYATIGTTAEGAATRCAPWSPRRDEIHVGWPAAWHWALKRKLNEISNRQELPRIGPIKLLPPVPRVYARILTVNFVVGN